MNHNLKRTGPEPERTNMYKTNGTSTPPDHPNSRPRSQLLRSVSPNPAKRKSKEEKPYAAAP